MKYKVILISGIAFSLALLAWLTFAPNADLTVPSSSTTARKALPNPLVTPTPIFAAAQQCAGEASEPYIRNALHETQIPTKSLEQLVSVAYRDPVSVLEKIKAGNTEAAVAYFKMAVSCVSPGHTDTKYNQRNCPSGVSREDAFIILNDAAEKGDVVAQATLAMNALSESRILRQEGTNDSFIASERLLKTSEKFGIMAARNGSQEAVDFMAGAYMNGSFGVRDSESAYLYLIPLAEKIQSKEMNDILMSVKKTLTEQTIHAVERKVYGCSVRSSTLQSPF